MMPGYLSFPIKKLKLRGGGIVDMIKDKRGFFFIFLPFFQIETLIKFLKYTFSWRRH
jgi:hypothetical protein